MNRATSVNHAILEAVSENRPFYWISTRKPHGMARMSRWRDLLTQSTSHLRVIK